MDIIISGKNFKLTPSLKTYVEEKVGRLGKFWKKIIRARVELGVQKNQKSGEIYGVEAKLEVPGPDISVEVSAHDMHAAIDLLVPKLERLIARVKGKIESKARKFRKDKDTTVDLSDNNPLE